MPVLYGKDELQLIEENKDKSFAEISNILRDKLGMERTPDAIRLLFKRRSAFGASLAKSFKPEEKPGLEAYIKADSAYPTPTSELTSLETKAEAHKLNEILGTEGAKESIIQTRYLDFLRNILQEIEPVEINRSPRDPKAESEICLLTDWHFGKLIDLSPLNEYNSKIATERVDKICQSFLKVVERYVNPTALIDEIIIVCAGDMIDNENIYETQNHHIDRTVVHQVIDVTKALFRFILSVRTSPLINPETALRFVAVKGNHGRTGKDTNEKSNWDLVTYYQLEAMCASNPITKKVSFEVSEDDYIVFQAKGWNGLVRHECPQNTSTPAARAKFGGWHAAHNFDFVCTGHWHNPEIGWWENAPVFRAGSLTGIDDLAERMARYSEPTQLAWGVTQKRVRTHDYILDIKDQI